jgi:hypothetical protein
MRELAGVVDTLCVVVVARRPGGASTDTLVSSALSLPLRNGPPYDSARVDFTFP